jgi:hydrogenase maturation protease
LTLSVLVLGIGNLLNTDEGLGVHAARQMQALLEGVEGVTVEDGGTLGLNLLPLVEDTNHLLLLDAVDAGQPPGSVVELTKEQIPLYSGIKMSQHQLTFQEVLGLALIRGRLPKNLHLVGVQPVSLEIGTDLSEPVAAALPQVVERALRVLEAWGVAVSPFTKQV